MKRYFAFIGIVTIAALLPLAAHNESPSAEIEADRPAEPALQTQAAPTGKTPGGFTVSGADAELAVNASAGTSPSLLFQENGTTIFSLQANSEWYDKASLRNSTGITLVEFYDTGSISCKCSNNANSVDILGSWFGLLAVVCTENSEAVRAANTYHDTSAYLATEQYGVYGQHHLNGNRGYIGQAEVGIWGCHGTTGNAAYIGGLHYGVYADLYSSAGNDHAIHGNHVASGNYGYIGGASYSMYANLAGSTPGNYAIYGYGVPNSDVEGTSYASNGTIGGVKGRSYYGSCYTFAVTGYSGLHYIRSGATFGAEPTGTTPWGCLAYRNSGGNLYGGYFTSYTSGSGLAAEDEPAAGIGLGAVGDLMGGWVRGGYYGLFVRGSRYGQYVQGDSYFSGCIAGIKQTESGKRVVTYAPASESPDVYAYGIGQLYNGAAQIEFSENFRGLVSDTEPLVVTVTAIGQGSQIALEAWDTNGFAVSSAPGANGDGQFTWIAIGKQKGMELHRAPAELLAPEFEDNMAQVTHNDGDTATDGLGMFVAKGQLHYGTPPTNPRPQPQEQE